MPRHKFTAHAQNDLVNIIGHTLQNPPGGVRSFINARSYDDDGNGGIYPLPNLISMSHYPRILRAALLNALTTVRTSHPPRHQWRGAVVGALAR